MTGGTLRENGLEVLEEVCPLSARMIVNQVSMQMQPERIVYVSCDSATLARDLKYLAENGYEVVKGRAIDNFPGGVHVECVMKLEKIKIMI